MLEYGSAGCAVRCAGSLRLSGVRFSVNSGSVRHQGRSPEKWEPGVASPRLAAHQAAEPPHLRELNGPDLYQSHVDRFSAHSQGNMRNVRLEISQLRDGHRMTEQPLRLRSEFYPDCRWRSPAAEGLYKDYPHRRDTPIPIANRSKSDCDSPRLSLYGSIRSAP
jgi:hypothetical protein